MFKMGVECVSVFSGVTFPAAFGTVSTQGLQTHAARSPVPLMTTTEASEVGSCTDSAERAKFDKALDKILCEIEPICFAEQKFCVDFFGIKHDEVTI